MKQKRIEKATQSGLLGYPLNNIDRGPSCKNFSDFLINNSFKHTFISKSIMIIETDATSTFISHLTQNNAKQ